MRSSTTYVVSWISSVEVRLKSNLESYDRRAIASTTLLRFDGHERYWRRHRSATRPVHQSGFLPTATSYRLTKSSFPSARIRNTARLGGTVVTVAPSWTAIVVWLPTTSIRPLGSRADVLGVD